MSSKLLNQTPVLDKGYVALFSASMSMRDLAIVQKEFFRGQLDSKLWHLSTVHFEIRCPLFVQLTFGESNLTHITQRTITKPEAYVPTVNEVNAQTLEASEAIQKDIEQTTAALLINPKAYQSENCNLFVSQVISPVSVYNTLIVSGSLNDWINYVAQKGLPSPIEAYRKVIEEILIAEWPFFREAIQRK